MNEALNAYGNELQVGLCERDFSLPRSDVFPQVTRCNSAQSSGQQIRHTQLTNRSYFVITTPVFGVVILIRESFEPISGQTMSPLRMVFVEHNDPGPGISCFKCYKAPMQANSPNPRHQRGQICRVFYSGQKTDHTYKSYKS